MLCAPLFIKQWGRDTKKDARLKSESQQGRAQRVSHGNTAVPLPETMGFGRRIGFIRGRQGQRTFLALLLDKPLFLQEAFAASHRVLVVRS